MHISLRTLISIMYTYCIIYICTRAWLTSMFGSVSFYVFVGFMLILAFGYFVMYRHMVVKIHGSLFFTLLFLYVCFIILSMLAIQTSSNYAVFEYLFYLSFFFANCFVLRYVPAESLFKRFEIIGIVISLEAIWEYVTGKILFRVGFDSDVQVIRRSFGLIGSPIILAMLLGCISLMCIYLGMRDSVKHYAFAGLTFVAMLCTQSRGPLVGYFTGIYLLYVIYGVTTKKDPKFILIFKRTWVVVASILLALGLVFLLSDVNQFANTIVTRLQSIFEWGSSNATNFERRRRWQVAFDVFKMHPFVGYGVSSTGVHGANGIITESGVLKRLAELGLIGSTLCFGTFVIGFFSKLINALSYKREVTAIAAGLVASIFVEDVVMQVVESYPIYLILMLGFAILFTAAENTGKVRNDK